MTSLHETPDNEHRPVPPGQGEFEALPLQQWPRQWHPSKHFPTPQSTGEGTFHQAAAKEVSYDRHASEYRLGDPNLPTAPYRRHIVDTVISHQTSVISSETGSGKSSQLGLYLLEAGFPRVFVTQPRIIAARNLLQWARHNLGEEHQQLAGYMTGNTNDSDCPEEARLIYVTEQLLFKMANRGKLRPDDVIINDEAHERTTATVILLGLVKEMLPKNSDMRLVVSSATIDTDLFSNYLKDDTGSPAPVLTLPGRTFPVESRETELSVAAAMRQQMRLNKNVLAFEPGISRLRTTAAKAASRLSTETVHTLYGDQSPQEQSRALDPADHHHVVASRIGETSITPPNKQVVVDGGLSNYGEYRAGVSGLVTAVSSQATMNQRKGRVGRTEEGLYIIATPDDVPPPPPFDERPKYDPPAIENSSVASFEAELLSAGRNLSLLDLIETPTHENLEYDRKLLVRLGAVAVENGNVELTDIGRAMIDLPLDAPLARMLVEARNQVDDTEIAVDDLRLQVAAAVAVQQVNGILDAKQGSKQRYRNRKSHQKIWSNEQSSEVLFALDVFIELYQTQQKMLASGKPGAEVEFDKLLVDNDILANRYYKAASAYEELCRREELETTGLTKATAAHRQRIVACQIAGAEEIFIQRSRQMHWDIRGEHRTLGRRSTVSPAVASLVIGTAFDLHGLSARGPFLKRFISGGTVVSSEQLIENAPHRIATKDLGYGVARNGRFVGRQALYFDGEFCFAEKETELPPTLDTRRALITAMMTGIAPSVDERRGMVAYRPGTNNAKQAVERWKAAQELEQRSRVKLYVAKRYASLISKTIRESIEAVPLEITDPAVLDELLPRVYLKALVRPTRQSEIPEIIREWPDSIKISGVDGNNQYHTITYDKKQDIAHVTLPRDVWASVRREDFADLESNHDVKVRFGRGSYMQIEKAFDHLEKLRQAELAKQTRREEHRLVAERKKTGEPTRREQRNDFEDQIEVQLKAQTKMMLQKNVSKGEPKNLRNQRMKKKQERMDKKAARQVVFQTA